MKFKIVAKEGSWGTIEEFETLEEVKERLVEYTQDSNVYPDGITISELLENELEVINIETGEVVELN